jgi:hypothetical protein
LFKPFWVIFIAGMLLVNCSIKSQLDSSVAANQIKAVRSPAIAPLTVFKVEAPPLKSTDQASVSFNDFTIPCQFNFSRERAEGPTFICGKDLDKKLLKTTELPLIYGVGQVWLPDSKLPSYLWVNQNLYSCTSTSTESLVCEKVPSSS